MDKVRDIMEADVITLDPTMSVGDVAAALDRAGITGAPVVDEQGVLLGIVTVRDVMRLARELVEVPEAARWAMGAVIDEEAPGGLDLPVGGEFFAYYVMPGGRFVDMRDRIRQLPESVFAGYEARDIMSPDPVTVESSMRIRELARLLIDRRIHRALVIEDGRLAGIVTATDVLRAVADG